VTFHFELTQADMERSDDILAMYGKEWFDMYLLKFIYRCKKKAECSGTNGQTVDSKTKLNDLLNNAPASYEGVVLQFKAGTYHYMCTRNNNFTNRSQKGTLIVK